MALFWSFWIPFNFMFWWAMAAGVNEPRWVHFIVGSFPLWQLVLCHACCINISNEGGVMTRKEVHEYSIAARKRVEDVWMNHGLRSTRAKLVAQCYQVVSGDRI